MPRTPHRWQTWACLLALGVVGFRAAAQETNRPPAADYSAFKMIADRNIFNANRFPGGAGARVRAPRVESVSLLGTMSYEKGRFAFFEGTSSEFTKAVKPEETIAGYKVSDIASQGVKLEAGTNTIDLKVGYQLRREDGGAWQVTMTAESSFQPDRGSSGADSVLRTDRGARDRTITATTVSGNVNRQDRQDRQSRRNGFGSQSGGNAESGSTSTPSAASNITSGGSTASREEVLQRLMRQREQEQR